MSHGYQQGDRPAGRPDGPRTWPREPKFQSASEASVWDGLVAALPPDAHLIGNVRLSDRNKNHEIDLLVLLPGRGAVVLEVKGSGITWRDGRWLQKRRGDLRPTHPVDQARDAMYAVRNLVENDPRWGTRRRLRWAHGVVTPFTRFGEDFSLPDLPRWMLHDKGDQGRLAERLSSSCGSPSTATRTCPPPTTSTWWSTCSRDRGGWRATPSPVRTSAPRPPTS